MKSYKEIVEAITWHMEAYRCISRECPPFRLSCAEEEIIFNKCKAAFPNCFPYKNYKKAKAQLREFMGCPVEIMIGE
jgi:hypothetical protein